MDKSKEIIFVGDIESIAYKLWHDWCVVQGYTFSHRSLESLRFVGHEKNIAVIMDEHGLNDEPLPKYGESVLDHVKDDLVTIRQLRNSYRHQMDLYKAISELPTVLDRQVVTIKVPEEAPLMKYDGMKTRRSKGDRKRNRRHRW